MFRLFKRKTKLFTWYAWIGPEGICFTSRALGSDGFGIIAPSLAGKTIQELKADGYKEAKTKMTQEQLSKGWLLL